MGHSSLNENKIYEVVDIGCGAGMQCMIWSKEGHNTHGIEINEPLLDLARSRARDEGLNIDYRLGTASDLPFENNSMDVCLVPELLEHVPEWDKCLDEIERITKTGGCVFISTNNKLCPKQQEFNLPFYSWYPAYMKRYFEKRAVTDRPQLVNYAKYPAINWFSFYTLRFELKKRGFSVMDRFDNINTASLSLPKRLMVYVVRANLLTHFVAQVLTPYTSIISIKQEKS